MRKLYTLFALLFITPVWTGAVVLNVNDWQLPEDPKPTPARAPAPKPVVRKAPASDGKEITIKLGAAYAPVSSTTDSSEIPVLKRSAEQLQKRLMGKSRFYVVFNANIKPTVDTIIEIPEGIRYALVRFGEKTGPYRIFLFEAEGDQKLLAVAEDIGGLLTLNRIYGTSFEVTEKGFTKAFPKAPRTDIQDLQAHKTYHAYQLPGPVFVVFADDAVQEQFIEETAFTDYANRLLGKAPLSALPEAPAAEGETPSSQEGSPLLAQADQPTRQSFKELVRSGTIFERMRRAEEEERRRAWEEMEGPWMDRERISPDAPSADRFDRQRKDRASSSRTQGNMRKTKNTQRNYKTKQNRNTQRGRNTQRERGMQRSRSR